MPIRPASLLVAVALAPLTALAAPPEGETRYLCCNMHLAGEWISDIGYSDDGMDDFIVPFGTPVKVVEVGSKQVRLEINGRQVSLGNDYSRKIGMAAFVAGRLLVDDPRPALKDLPAETRRAIEDLDVRPGMTKSQVIVALGYPIDDENKSYATASTWHYWWRADKPYDVNFGADGLVQAVVDKSTPNADASAPPCALNIYRANWAAGDDSASTYLMVDGELQGRLAAGTTYCLALPAGRHAVAIRNVILYAPGVVVTEKFVEITDPSKPVYVRYQKAATAGTRWMALLGGALAAEASEASTGDSRLSVVDELFWRRRL